MPRKTTPEKKNVKKAEAAPAPASAKEPFLTVGIGASAGGLEALVDLMHHLPEKPNAAFVIIHHADPTHPSSMRHILARESRIGIVDLEIDDATPVQPNTVYIAPGGCDVTMTSGVLHVAPPAKKHTRMPIDFFFRSLADDQGPRAVGVILSGSASDG